MSVDDIIQKNKLLRGQDAENDLKKITALTSDGVLVVRVSPKYEEGKTSLSAYMP